MKRNAFFAGVKAGMPVCIGYFSVSFGFGAMAIAQGLTIWESILISASNLTSAGQFAGLTVIAAGAALLEMILTQLLCPDEPCPRTAAWPLRRYRKTASDGLF